MSDERIFEVQAQEDFVERLAAARPAQALAELIWNSLDAEATSVSIQVDEGPLGLTAIRICDNGHGIPPEEAPKLFGHLGGSWKKSAKRSKNEKRMLHGEEGKGRFRALALGRVAEWSITAPQGSGSLFRYRVTVIKDTARTFRVSDSESVDGVGGSGVEVTITEPHKAWDFKASGLLQELNEIYALYMTDYPTVSITVLGDKLNPATLIEARKTFSLPKIPNDDKPPFDAELEVFEWKTQTERMLYLCSAEGFPLHRLTPGIQAPGFDFSAYLRSAYVSQLHDQGILDLSEMDPRLNASIEESKGLLRDHFKARAAEKSQGLVDEWKAEDVYPYAQEPTSLVQVVERQVFDIVAVDVATHLSGFQSQDKRNRKFQLRMLRQAIERGPEELQLILGEVLELSNRKREELAKLLTRTTLSEIISASKMVADRLDFIGGLAAMLFDPDLKKHFRERSQLHRLVAANTWIFGEEFALAVDDQSLTEVLRKHLELMGRDVVVNTPVKRLDKTTGIVDLMLSRRVPTNREEEREHLVVELKAPTVKVGQEETGQIKSYAFAVMKDERFRSVPTRWTFWVVSNDIDEYAELESHMSGKPEGLLWEDKDSRIWIKTWGQILHDCETRLRIFQNALNYSADKDASLEYLRKTYARVLSGIGPETDVIEPPTEDAENDAGAASSEQPLPSDSSK